MTARIGLLGGEAWSRTLGVRMIRVLEWARGSHRVRMNCEHGRHRTCVELGLEKGAGQTK